MSLLRRTEGFRVASTNFGLGNMRKIGQKGPALAGRARSPLSWATYAPWPQPWLETIGLRHSSIVA